MRKLLPIVLVPFVCASFAAFAQEEERGTVARSFFVQTKMGHGSEFRDGIKKYWECYEKNGGEWSWIAWSRTSGQLGMYLFRSDGHDWADFDADDPAGEACNDSFDVNVTPHVEMVSADWSTDMPEVSRHEEGDMTIAYVGVFWVNNGPKFQEMITSFHSATSEKNWGHYHWGTIMTSEDGADYYLAIMNADYADMAPPETPFWEIQEQVHGKRKTEEMRQTLRDIIDKSAWYTYRRMDDISFTPGS